MLCRRHDATALCRRRSRPPAAQGGGLDQVECEVGLAQLRHSVSRLEESIDGVGILDVAVAPLLAEPADTRLLNLREFERLNLVDGATDHGRQPQLKGGLRRADESLCTPSRVACERGGPFQPEEHAAHRAAIAGARDRLVERIGDHIIGADGGL